MQNTKTEYSSSERTPVVLPEMEQLLPPLSGEQFSACPCCAPAGSWSAPPFVSGRTRMARRISFPRPGKRKNRVYD